MWAKGQANVKIVIKLTPSLFSVAQLIICISRRRDLIARKAKLHEVAIKLQEVHSELHELTTNQQLYQSMGLDLVNEAVEGPGGKHNCNTVRLRISQSTGEPAKSCFVK